MTFNVQIFEYSFYPICFPLSYISKIIEVVKLIISPFVSEFRKLLSATNKYFKPTEFKFEYSDSAG